MPQVLIDIADQRFGRLRIVKRHECKGPSKWDAICDCGKECIVGGHSVREGRTKSCGCLHRESIGNRARKHGMTRSNTYMVWSSMKARCLNEKSQYYRLYGGKGIRVCERWMSFENFLEDMGIQPNGMQIDRIDGNKGYELSNCRWVTPVQQGNNTSRNRRLTHNGKTMTIAEWGRHLGFSRKLIWDRIDAGWPVHDALTRPAKKSVAV